MSKRRATRSSHRGARGGRSDPKMDSGVARDMAWPEAYLRRSKRARVAVNYEEQHELDSFDHAQTYMYY